VRISVQLVKVSDGYHLWSETYDRTLEDILAVQEDIARTVVGELRSTVLGEVPDLQARLAVNAEVAAAARGAARAARRTGSTCRAATSSIGERRRTRPRAWDTCGRR